MPGTRRKGNVDRYLRPPQGVCEACLHQVHKPCANGAIQSQTFGNVWWWWSRWDSNLRPPSLVWWMTTKKAAKITFFWEGCTAAESHEFIPSHIQIHGLWPVCTPSQKIVLAAFLVVIHQTTMPQIIMVSIGYIWLNIWEKGANVHGKRGLHF